MEIDELSFLRSGDQMILIRPHHICHVMVQQANHGQPNQHHLHRS
jgi:hypothetical protein